MNLLPSEEKIRIRTRYRLRIFIVSAVLFSIVLILAIVPTVASYFIISNKIELFKNELSVIKNVKKEGVDPYVDIVKEVSREMSVLDKTTLGSPQVGIYDLLKLVYEDAVAIRESRGSFITLNNISYDYRLPGKKEKVGGLLPEFYYNKITMSGMASDRASLQAFIQLFKNDSKFANVESPISNFIASKDISFSLTLNLKN